MTKHAFLLDGPIGSGKTTLGRQTAARLGFAFIDGDDYSAPGPWLRSILTTSRAIAAAGIAALGPSRGVVIAYPIRCKDWIFYRETFARAGVACHCIGLTADIHHISGRARQLSSNELARSVEMIKEGYGRRSFSSVIIRTDTAGFEETCQQLVIEMRHLMDSRA